MAAMDSLSPYLLETIRRGDAILFLGAGATVGAQGPNSLVAPKGDELRDQLCNEFLGGELKSRPLARIGDYSINKAGLFGVQQYIKNRFDPLQPALFHLLIPTFRWFAIVTTNYDLVIERAYEKYTDRLQKLEPIIQDGDRFTNVIRDPNSVPYLKLHGCISHISDADLPLTLSSEQYARHKKNRERLFKHFADWARERPVIFCGYDVGDPNIQQIVFDLEDLKISRPVYAIVNCGLDSAEQDYWSSRRFEVYPGKFEEFLCSLNPAIPAATRTLAALLTSSDTSIKPLIKTQASPSIDLLRYLEQELQHVFGGIPTTGVSPTDFYNGLRLDWGAFQQGLDIRRRITDDVILEAVLEQDESSRKPEIFLLKGYAGSGKSVTLRRLAWDVATEYGGVVFFLQDGGLLRRNQLQELTALIGQRIFVFIDDVISHVSDVQNLLGWCEKTGVPITLIVGARSNEWNVYAGDLEENTSAEYELRDLTEKEIRELLRNLESYDVLGRLKSFSDSEKMDHFKLTSDRQLLVALHDLTDEKSFEEIVFDEYKNIVPQEARTLYLDVCTLHRLGVGVRAGLISRISGITFQDFERNFFRPLEHVIYSYFDHGTRDNMYRSRHRSISELVFETVLDRPADRSEQLVRIVRNLDIDYTTDEAAFRQILRGKVLAELFSDRGLALRVFEAARESGAQVSVVEHQRAVFEMNHKNGSLEEALRAIERAVDAQDYQDKAVQHTKANILREIALKAPQRLVREKLREDAKEIISKSLSTSRVAHPFATMARLLMDDLKDKLQEDFAEDSDISAAELRDRAIADLIRRTEEAIRTGLQRFHDDVYLLDIEAALARVLEDEKRALSALSKAFKANPGKEFIAVRYAAALAVQGDDAGAVDVLRKSIAGNPTGREAHFALAKNLIKKGEQINNIEISHHLKRSFTSGDANINAQFWYARQEFLYGDRAAAIGIFSELGKKWTPAEYRNRVRGVIKSDTGVDQRFSGFVARMGDHFCHIRCSDLNFDIYAQRGDFDDELWQNITNGTQLWFAIGFGLRGPRARSISLNGSAR